jgi:hypothetical protein
MSLLYIFFDAEVKCPGSFFPVNLFEDTRPLKDLIKGHNYSSIWGMQQKLLLVTSEKNMKEKILLLI